jgi:hypothetical protein
LRRKWGLLALQDNGLNPIFIESHTPGSIDYDTVNVRMGAPAGFYIRTRNPSDSMELLFYTPSTHFKNLN